MPKLVAKDLSHDEFHDHVNKHNTEVYHGGPVARLTSIFHTEAPKTPKAVGHKHYHKHKDHTPASLNGSIFVFPDIIFGAGFIGAMGMLLAFCWTYGYDSTQDGTDEENSGRSTFQAIVAGAVVMSVLTAFVYIKILVTFGASIIKCLVFSCVGMLLMMAMVCVAMGLPNTAIPFGVVGGVAGIYFGLHMAHLDFAGACLEVACAVIKNHPTTEFIALATIGVQAAWSMVFSTALVGLQVYMLENKDAITADNASGYMAYFFCVWIAIILTFYWGQQVVRNIVVCTTAGTTAEWWFNREEVGSPTWHAFWRSCTTNLGTIAFGSFLVAVIQTVCYVINKTKKYVDKAGFQALACMLRCLVCLLRCIQKWAEIFNFYTYVVVGIYGYGFMHAGAHVVGIFASKGMLLAEEGSLIEMVLMLGTAVVALVSGATGALVAYNNPELVTGVPYPITSTMITCTIVGHGIAHTMFAVVSAANATVFISYIENPHALHNDHPKEYAKLHAAWIGMGRKEVEHDWAEKWEETDEERTAALLEEEEEERGAASGAAGGKGRARSSVDRPPGTRASMDRPPAGSSNPLASAGGPKGLL